MKRLRLYVRQLVVGVAFGAVLASAQAQDVSTTSTADAIVEGARMEAEKQTPYIMNYEVLDYPGGDVAEGTGVCTDLVVRAFRHAGIDLQKEIYLDRKARPDAYPSIWEKTAIDRNIDHRRCPNMVAWLRKHAESLPIEYDADSLEQWQAGDIVFYVREGATHPWHVGIVSDKRDNNGMPYIIDSFPPHTSESHKLDTFAPIHSHFRMK